MGYDPYYEDPFYGLERQRRHRDGFAGAGLGMDTQGDLVENFGDGIGIDLDTGQIEVEIFPGFDIPLD